MVKKIYSKQNIWIVLPFSFFLLDTLLTYYAVFIYGKAIELNPIVKFLWSYGVVGESIRIMWVLGIFLFVHKKLNSNNKKMILASKIWLIFISVIWFVVVMNNILQLLLF